MLVPLARTITKAAALKFADLSVAAIDRAIDWCAATRADYQAFSAEFDRLRRKQRG